MRPVTGEFDPTQYKLVKGKVPAIQKRVAVLEGPAIQQDQKVASAAVSAFRPEIATAYISFAQSSGSPESSPIVGDPLMALQRVRQAQSQEYEQAIKNQVEVQSKAVDQMAKLRRCMEEFERMKTSGNDLSKTEATELGKLMQDAGILDGEAMMKDITDNGQGWFEHQGEHYLRVKAGENDDKPLAEKAGLLLKRIENKLNNAMDNIKDQQRLNDHKSSTLAKQFTNAEESTLNLQNMGHKLLDIVTSKTFQP